MKIELSTEEQITFYKFLKHECEDPPTNLSEWGHEWCMLNNLKSAIELRLTNGILKIKQDEFWAVFNFLSARCDEIIEKQIGEIEFKDHLRLFIVFHNATQSKYPINIFCAQEYVIVKNKTIYVIDPTVDPEFVLTDPKKYSVKFYPSNDISTKYTWSTCPNDHDSLARSGVTECNKCGNAL
ncbi:MAG: hypothetical protein ACOYM0_01150 [Bacteroidales bacterium]